MPNPTKEQVLAFLKAKGPTIPVKIKQALGGDNLFIIGAILSDLVAEGKVKVTHLKLGGTPFYYLPGQEQRLITLRQYLNSKDQTTFDLLKKEKILRDRDLSPLLRVSLRNIKDFAKPLEVQVNEIKELFWKWFLVSQEEAVQIIKEKYFGKKKESREKSESKEEVRGEKKDKLEREEKNNRKEINIVENKSLKEFIPQKNFLPLELNKLPDSNRVKLETFLLRNNIEVHNVTSISKNNFEAVVYVPTPLTKIKFYLVAKFKKKCSAQDLNQALDKSKVLGLPLIFLTTGSFSKNADNLILKVADKNTIIRRI